ncbi:hypothetical protein [Paraburkholderia edwinii]|jgi:predicted patatin/cPLA2 family phospholipase|uniref:hypothetical protein n=1 Tax=Paraburkholderia edwinii TaxID=2861782 RepID=UPI001FE362E6|nr:hypothetical protein [Paraburkholderia edwinii]
MLSPHEFATLMLVRQAPDQLDMDRAELDTLLERQLVMLEHCGKGARRAYLTGKGRTFLDALQAVSAIPRSQKTSRAGGGARPSPSPTPGSQPTDSVEPRHAG